MNWLRFITSPPATPKGVEKRSEPPTTGVHYDTSWSRRPAARLVRTAGVWGFMKPAIRIYGSPRVIGRDRVEQLDGPVIFAANHHSHADTTLMLATLPGHLREKLAVAAGADYFFPNKITGALSALFIGAIPIERQKISKLSVSNTIGVIEDGYSLLIYPEGGRSPDGWAQEHRPGAAFVAKQTGVPVVPIYIDGTGTILPKGKNWPTRARCAVVFGDPLTLGEGENPRDFAKRVEQRIHELADEFGTGWWQARRNAHAGATPRIDGPDAGAWRRRWALGPKKSAKRPARRWPKL
ncbi:MAG: lysophospholipid acyltransferase family protein [Acidimicrobiales bacterium]